MNWKRILRHLFTPTWKVRQVFPASALRAIETAIRNSESGHYGEIRFAVEAALDGRSLLREETPRERAVELFSQLRVWDTERNNGVLIYLLLADRRVEILADRGIHRDVGEAGWAAICREMEQAFRRGLFEQGAVAGIQAVAGHLTRHYPSGGANENELPDQPVIL